jgi:hypothetical protein
MTPRELAEEAREAIRRRPLRTPEEEWQRLLDSGLIKMVNQQFTISARNQRSVGLTTLAKSSSTEIRRRRAWFRLQFRR